MIDKKKEIKVEQQMERQTYTDKEEIERRREKDT